MAERYFSSIPLSVGNVAKLDGSEAHHVLNVMRAVVGQELALFDGNGYQFLGTIQQLSRSEVLVVVNSEQSSNCELSQRILVAAAVPKGDRLRFLVEKLTELGAAAYLPLGLDRSVNRLNSGLEKKMRRWIIEASKQCLRNQLMMLLPEMSLNQVVSQFASSQQRWIACTPKDGAVVQANQPVDATPLNNPIDDLSLDQASRPFDHIILIGPEGGFTDEEIQMAIGANFQPLSLGKSVLRIETAAIAAMSYAAMSYAAMSFAAFSISGINAEN